MKAKAPALNSSRLAIGCGAALLLAALFTMFTLIGGSQVPQGHVGIVTTWGRADSNVRQPGWNFVWPGAQNIVDVDVRTQNHVFKEVNASSKELQSVKLDGGVNYKIDPNKAYELYNTVGLDFAGKVFDPAFTDYVKEVVPKYSTTEILANREAIRNGTRDKLKEKASEYGIEVLDIFITNIGFSDAYIKAIEAKQVSAQQLEQAKIDAQKAAAVAEGAKNAQIAQAQGDAESNRLRQQNLTPELVQYLAVQKWNGVLPLSTSGTPFINLPTTAR